MAAPRKAARRPTSDRPQWKVASTASMRAQQARDPVGPDVAAGAEMRRLHQVDRGRLQPVDAGRLLVPLLLADPDADIVAGVQHLLRRLGEAGLVAVGRRQGEEAGQPQQQAEQHQRQARPALQGLRQGAEGAVGTGRRHEIHGRAH